MKRKLITAFVPALFVLSSLAMAQQGFFVKPLVEKKVTELPSGDLFWRIDTFDTKQQAQEAGGPKGSVTAVHTHPGSEVFYVLAGELTQKTPHGAVRLTAGQGMVGHGVDTPMEVSNSGSGDLREFALFVVDATKPFSSPAHLH